jgi:SAM-dependent methyltransferase
MSSFEQRDFWDRRAEAWERRADALGAFSDVYGFAAMDALGVSAGERVLDVGCGPGTTTIELAGRVGSGGEVVGVDISSKMVAAASRRAAGVGNVRFNVADAQTDDLGSGYDALYSRFGVMFFPDPPAAFANLGRALRPGGRLGFAVWGPLADNPWMFVPTLAAAPILNAELALPGPGQPGPFSLSDADQTAVLLAGAGFVDVAITPVRGERVITEGSTDNDVRTLLEVGPLGEAYESADDPTKAAAVEAIVAALAPYREGDGWRLPGAGLTITARRP